MALSFTASSAEVFPLPGKAASLYYDRGAGQRKAYGSMTLCFKKKTVLNSPVKEALHSLTNPGAM